MGSSLDPAIRLNNSRAGTSGAVVWCCRGSDVPPAGGSLARGWTADLEADEALIPDMSHPINPVPGNRPRQRVVAAQDVGSKYLGKYSDSVPVFGGGREVLARCWLAGGAYPQGLSECSAQVKRLEVKRLESKSKSSLVRPSIEQDGGLCAPCCAGVRCAGGVGW